MSTNYPGSLDTTSNLPDTITDGVATQTVHAAYHNNVNDAVLAVEGTLGVNPQGSYSTVVARLNDSVTRTPGNGSQVIKPSLDERAFVLRPFSDAQTNKLVEIQNAAGASVIGYIDKTGNASFASLAIAGTALASTNLSDTSSIARLASTNTFTVGQTISANSGLTLSGSGSKSLLAITATSGNPGLTIGSDTTLYRSASNTLATDGALTFPQSTGTTVVLSSSVSTVLAFDLKANGTHEWANGSGAVDTNWYRRGVSLIGTDYTVDVGLEVISRSGATAQTKIGALGPSNQAGITFGTSGTFTFYLSGVNAVTSTGLLVVGGLQAPSVNATIGFQVNGSNLASTHLADSASLARSASPSLTGTPTTTTAAVDTNTSQIASTAFVLGQAASATPLVDGSAAVGTSTRFARADHVHPTDTTRAPLASPALTGTPTTPTASALTNNTQVASTAYVDSAVASGLPPGVVLPFAGFIAPTGFLMADGSSTNRTTNANLFNNITFTQATTTTNLSTSLVVSDSTTMFVGMAVEGTGVQTGTTVSVIVDPTHVTLSLAANASGSPTCRFFPHGNGNGTTTFNVPDGQGRGIHGRGTHASVSAVGKSEGLAVSSRTPLHGHGLGTIAISASGSHAHTFTGTAGTTDAQGSHSHGVSGSTSGVGDHSHSGTPTGFNLFSGYNFSGSSTAWTNGSANGGSTGAAGGHSHSVSGGTDTQGSHSHNVTPAGTNSSTMHVHNTGDFSGTIGTTSSAPLEAPAYLVLNYIVKT